MKIFLIGWFGAGNMGDEAILISELYDIKRSIPEVEFYILSFNPDRTQSLTAKIPEVKRIVRMGAKKNIFQSELLGLLKTFHEVDVVFIGGGGLFQDLYNYYPIPFFTMMAILTKLFRKRLIFYCQGFGPLQTFAGKKLCAFAVNLAEMISVRDTESKGLLRELGVKKEICLAADPVFSLDAVKSQKVEALTRRFLLGGEKRPVIVVCLHDLLSWSDTSKQCLAESLDELVKTRHAKIIFLPLGAYKNRWTQVEQSDSVDVVASKQIAALMAECSSIIDEELAPQEFLALIRQTNLLISMRFHGLVMGLTANVPVIALTFRQETKLRNLMRRIKQEESVFDVEGLEPEAFLRRIEHVFSQGDEIKKQLLKSVTFLRTESERSNELLCQFLRDIH